MEEEFPILARDHDQRAFNQLVSLYGAPAYIRRARQVEEALEQLLRQCRQVRDRWLMPVRIRLETLRLLAGDWSALRPWLADEGQVGVLEALHRELQPRLRMQVARTAAPRRLQAALAQLVDSLARFNRRWQEHLPRIDLTPVNAARDGYNRYSLLEKECALRSPRLARLGFERLEPLTTTELARLLPLLPVPRLAAGS